MERYHFLLIKLEVFSVLNAKSVLAGCHESVSSSSPAREWGLAQPLLLQTTGTAHLTGVGPAAQRSQAKQVLSWMQCVCLVSKETHIAENVQCFTKSTKQRSLQGPSSLLLQSNRKKLKWQRRCASTSLCH